MSNYQPINLKLQDAIQQIHGGEIQLPEFQRSYNWKPAALVSLIDSIQKNYPVGALLLLEVDPKTGASPFGLRPFEGAPIPTAGPKYLVLDGQQRLSSCYHSFRASSSRWYCIDLKKLHQSVSERPGSPVDFETLIVRKKPTDQPDTLLFKSHLLPMFFITNRKAMRARLTNYENNLLANEATTTYGHFIQDDLEGYLDVFFEYSFPAVVLPSSLDLEAVSNVFTKLNTQGLRLSAFDLCVASLYPHKVNLREELTKAKSNSGVKTFDQDGTNLLQTVALLAGKPPKKAGLVRNITKVDIDTFWTSAVRSLQDVSEMIQHAGVWGTRTLPYDALIPPLVASVASAPEPKNEGNKATRNQRVQRLIIQTAFLGRYNEGTDVKQASDFGLIKEWLKAGTVPAFLEDHVVWTDSSHNLPKSGARAKAIVAILNQRSPKDLIHDSMNLGVEVNGRTSSEIHHIFPRAYLKSQGLEKEAERALNLTFLSKESNNFIDDRAPSVYLGEIVKRWRSSGIPEEKAQERLHSLLLPHLVDANGVQALLNDDYEAFLVARGSTLMSYLSSIGIPVLMTSFNDEDDEMDEGEDEEDVDD